MQRLIMLSMMQGETFTLHVSFTACDEVIDPQYISRVVLKVPEMEKVYELVYDEITEDYIFTLSSEESRQYFVGTLDFFVNLEFTDGSIKNCIYEGKLKVLQEV